MTGEKKKRPIFTYIVTASSTIIPTFIYTILGLSLVIGTHVETGNKISFIEVFYPSFIFGAAANLICSWVYFSKVHKRIWRPHWWTNLLLIIVSYAALPLFAAITGMEEYDPNAGIPAIGSLFVETMLLAIIGFIAIRSRKKKNTKMHTPRMLSPLWLPLAIPTYYMLFFFSLITSVNLIKIGFAISGHALYALNMILRLPFFTSATEGLVKAHLPGALAHIIFVANALIWGTIVWIMRRQRAKKFQPLEGENE